MSRIPEQVGRILDEIQELTQEHKVKRVRLSAAVFSQLREELFDDPALALEIAARCPGIEGVVKDLAQLPDEKRAAIAEYVRGVGYYLNLNEVIEMAKFLLFRMEMPFQQAEDLAQAVLDDTPSGELDLVLSTTWRCFAARCEALEMIRISLSGKSSAQAQNDLKDTLRRKLGQLACAGKAECRSVLKAVRSSLHGEIRSDLLSTYEGVLAILVSRSRNNSDRVPCKRCGYKPNHICTYQNCPICCVLYCRGCWEEDEKDQGEEDEKNPFDEEGEDEEWGYCENCGGPLHYGVCEHDDIRREGESDHDSDDDD